MQMWMMMVIMMMIGREILGSTTHPGLSGGLWALYNRRHPPINNTISPTPSFIPCDYTTVRSQQNRLKNIYIGRSVNFKRRCTDAHETERVRTTLSLISWFGVAGTSCVLQPLSLSARLHNYSGPVSSTACMN